MPKFNKKAAIEALKTVLRIGLFAAASSIVAYLLQVVAGIPDETMRVILTAALTWADRYLFKASGTDQQGLTQRVGLSL